MSLDNLGELRDGHYHVKTKVSQYEILQDTSRALGGSQMPFVASSSVLALEARSIGTRRTMVAGSHNAKKTGTSRKAGVVRNGR